jgi:hypothetical protein
MTLPGLVVVGYRRPESLQDVLRSVPSNAVSSVLISLDGPSGDWDRHDVDSVEMVARRAAANWSGRAVVKTRQSNVGSAVNVLEAVSLGLQDNENLIVLEDDCIPSLDFWAFTTEMLARYESDRSVLCVCGSQLAPDIASDYSHILSDFPLMWGWATWRPKWREFLSLLQAYLALGKAPSLRDLPAYKRSYWRAGFRRSSRGFVDAWDIPLQSVMLHHRYKAVLPTSNLVRNTGSDARATHVSADSHWTRVPIGEWNREGLSPTSLEGRRMDSWLEQRVFRIRPRHLASTVLTHGLDVAGINKRGRSPLIERLRGVEPIE